jgi:hypothetical protein
MNLKIGGVLFIFTVCINVGCVDRIGITVNDYVELLVVEGEIVNQPGPYSISLTRTQVYDGSKEPITIDNPTPELGAVIKLYDSKGNCWEYQEMGNGSYSLGDESMVIGEVGNSYMIRIETNNGKVYESTSQILPEPSLIDTMYYVIDGESSFDIFVDVLDYTLTENHYLWRWEGSYHLYGNPPDPEPCCRICFMDEKGRGIKVLSSQLRNGDGFIRQVPVVKILPGTLTKYVVNVKQFTISEEAFQFWAEIQKQQDSNGGLLSTLPGRLPGNLFNINDNNEQVIGFFGAFSVVERALAIERGKVLNRAPASLFDNDCRLFLGADTIRPPYWID